MFEINGVFKEKFYQGQVIRMKNSFKQSLNTKEGVIRFIEDNQPFDEITIRSIIDNKDVTDNFIKKDSK